MLLCWRVVVWSVLSATCIGSGDTRQQQQHCSACICAQTSVHQLSHLTLANGVLNEPSRLALSVFVGFLAMSSEATYREEDRFVERSSIPKWCLRIMCRRENMVLPCVKYDPDECTRSECESFRGA
jgi:hypothetical protein